MKWAEDVPSRLIEISRSRPETTIALARSATTPALAWAGPHSREEYWTPGARELL